MTQSLVEREIVERLKPIGPRLVVLFGSRARGQGAPDSDYDLLVVLDAAAGDEFRTPRVRAALGDLGAAFDLVVYTPDEWESWQGHPLAFAHHIQQTGRVLYTA